MGLHYLGPNAGEIMQGLAIAFKKGITKQDLDECIGMYYFLFFCIIFKSILKNFYEGLLD